MDGTATDSTSTTDTGNTVTGTTADSSTTRITRIDRRLTLPFASGRLLRTSPDPSGVHLAYVTAERTVQVATGAGAVAGVLRGWFDAVWTAAVQDDYGYWAGCGESDGSGKLLLVEGLESPLAAPTTVTPNNPTTATATTTTSNSNSNHNHHHHSNNPPIQIFFDDNIERDRAHIVDVRSAASFQALPFAQTENVFLKKAEPYQAITDVDYYIKAVEEMLPRQEQFRREYGQG
jgi:hypothetical protein